MKSSKETLSAFTISDLNEKAAVDGDGYREVLGASEMMKEDKASRVDFFQWLKGRAQENKKAAREGGGGSPCRTKLPEAAKKIEEGIEETLADLVHPEPAD